MTTSSPRRVELVVLAADQERTIGSSLHRLHRYVHARPSTTGAAVNGDGIGDGVAFDIVDITVVDYASRDDTWSAACDAAATLDGVTVRHLDARLDAKVLRAHWSASAADVVAFVRIGPTTDLATVLAPVFARARVSPLLTDANVDGETARRGVLSRRGALVALGGLGLTALVAACGGSSKSPAKAADTSAGSSGGATSGGGTATTTGTSGSAGGATTTVAPVAPGASGAALALTPEMTQGPYYLDLDKVRSDIREDRVGAPLTLAMTVVDAAGSPIKDAAVDIWHCDANGIYSGFVSQSTSSNGGGGAGGGPGGPPPGGGQGGPPPGGGQGGPPPGGGQGGPPPGGGQGGGLAATPSDPSTFLRGTQLSDTSGKVSFTTVYPGWYQGRTVHIHVLVHVGGKVTHIGQLFFDDGYTDGVYKANAPYSSRPARDTRNDSDGIYQGGGAATLLDVTKSGDGYATAVTMAVKTA